MGEVRRVRGALFLALAVAAATLPSPAAARPKAVPAGSRYVAIGSSFAAGPGVGPARPGAPSRCGRGTLNYPSLVAKARKLVLVDATCSGATTQHVLGPWNELPPQIASVDAQTRLVTITIGGNDIAFVGNIVAAACEVGALTDPNCPTWRKPAESEWTADEARMRRIVREVRARAPDARIMFIDYFTIVPPRGNCPAVPIGKERLDASRAAAARLAAMTARVARQEGAELVRFGRMSRSHSPCARKPWGNGIIAPPGDDGTVFHINRAGHEAAAKAVIRRID